MQAVAGYTLQYEPAGSALGLGVRALELPSSRRYLGLLRKGAKEKGLHQRYVDEKLGRLRPFL